METLDQAGTAQRGLELAERLVQLHEVARIGEVWLETLAPDASQRASVMEMCRYAEESAARGDGSPDVMITVRAILCSNCRRIDAAQGKCSGAALDQCMFRKDLPT